MYYRQIEVYSKINDINGEGKKTAEKMDRQCRGIITINWSRLKGGIL